MTFDEWWKANGSNLGSNSSWARFAWDAATVAERERCAKIAETADDNKPDGIPVSDWRTEMGDGYGQASRAIAAAIRGTT